MGLITERESMAAYMVANFNVTNPEGYKAYVPAVITTLNACGAEVLVADYATEPLEGEPGIVTVVIRFASKQALSDWYNSDEYQKNIHLRTDNTAGLVVSADEFNLETTLANLEKL